MFNSNSRLKNEIWGFFQINLTQFKHTGNILNFTPGFVVERFESDYCAIHIFNILGVCDLPPYYS